MVQLRKDILKKSLKNELDDVLLIIPETADPGDTISVKDYLKKGHWDIVLKNYKNLNKKMVVSVVTELSFLDRLNILFTKTYKTEILLKMKAYAKLYEVVNNGKRESEMV